MIERLKSQKAIHITIYPFIWYLGNKNKVHLLTWTNNENTSKAFLSFVQVHFNIYLYINRMKSGMCSYYLMELSKHEIAMNS